MLAHGELRLRRRASSPLTLAAEMENNGSIDERAGGQLGGLRERAKFITPPLRGLSLLLLLLLSSKSIFGS